MKQTILTKQGMEKFKDELKNIIENRKPAAEERVRKAVEDGCGAGDHAYDDAQAEFDFYEQREIYLGYCIQAAVWIEEKNHYVINHPSREDGDK